MRSWLRAVTAWGIAALVTVGAAQAQEGLTKRDARGPVTVVVTLADAPAAGAPLKVQVVLDTHSVGLDGIAFDQAVVLRSPDGTDARAAAVEQSPGGGHHRQALLVFAPVEKGPIRIVVKDVGGIPERVFLWDLPTGR
jgi:hypothetical protein